MTPVAPQGIASTRRGYEWAVKSAADAAKDWRALLLPLEGEDSGDEGTSELGDEIDETAPSPTAANRKRSHDFMDSLGGRAQPNV